MTEPEIAALARRTFADVHQLVSQRRYDDAEDAIKRAISEGLDPGDAPSVPAYAHLTPETRAIVEALHEHREAVDTLLKTEEHGPRPPRPAISRVLHRAIARLVVLDTRLEHLKRRKKGDGRDSAIAADRPEKP